MKKTSSKLLCLALVLIMVMSMIACGETTGNGPGDDYYNQTGYPICDETITISVTGGQGASLDWNNTYFVKYVEEELGIRLDCAPAPDAATYYTTSIASGNIPDLWVNMGMDINQVAIDGADGYWLDFSEYMHLMPNLKALMDKYPDFAKFITEEDGSIYALGRVNPGIAAEARAMIYYEKDVVTAAGITGEIKTINDFYNALKAVKAKYPDKTPLAITFGAQPAFNADIILRTAFGIPFGDNQYMIYEDENGKVQLGDISDNNKAYLEWLNKLHSEGLLEIYTGDRTQYRAEIAEHEFVFWSDSAGPTFWDNLANVGMIAALTNATYTTESSYLLNTNITNQARIFVNAETEYPEAICRFIDFLCTEKGQYLACYGEEGVHFDLPTDAYGAKYLDAKKYAIAAGYTTPDGNADTGTFHNKVVAPNQAFALVWGVLGEQYYDFDKATLAAMAADPGCADQWTAMIAEALEGVDNVTYRKDQIIRYTEDEASERKTKYTDLVNHLKAYRVNFIQGTSDLTWEQYVAKTKTMGWDFLQPIEQAAWDRIWG